MLAISRYGCPHNDANFRITQQNITALVVSDKCHDDNTSTYNNDKISKCYKKTIGMASKCYNEENSPSNALMRGSRRPIETAQKQRVPSALSPTYPLKPSWECLKYLCDKLYITVLIVPSDSYQVFHRSSAFVHALCGDSCQSLTCA